MNELLQKHGCANVFNIPEGLRELMSDITREVLRAQPKKIFDFIANYLSALLITREHGVMAVKILDELCDCRPSVSEHLLQLGVGRAEADGIAEVIKEAIEAHNAEPEEGREKVKEMDLLKKILTRFVLDEETTAKVTQVARNAYRDYCYRKLLLEQSIKPDPEEPWEIAAQHTLSIYKKTKPSFNELSRATEKIQAAYKGYHVRRDMLRHLKPKPKPGPKVDLPGPPVDVAESREIDLGRIIDIKVKEDDVGVLFDMDISGNLGLSYDPMRTITHVEDEALEVPAGASRSSRVHGFVSSKSLGAQSDASRTAQAGSAADHRQSRPSISSAVRSRLMSELKPESRVSQTPSAVSRGRQSRLHSQIPSEAPPEIITVPVDGEDVDVKEAVSAQGALEGEDVQEVIDIQESEESPDVQIIQEIPEVVEENESEDLQEPQEVQEVIEPEAPEAALEVPEDITVDDRTEGEGASAPVSLTIGDTDATDVEEMNTTGDDEGE